MTTQSEALGRAAAGGATDARVRPTHGADQALRLTVVGGTGRLDVAVPMWLEVEALAQEYADAFGLPAAPRLTRAGGRELDPAATLEDVLEQGDVLTAVAPAARAPTAGPAPAETDLDGGPARSPAAGAPAAVGTRRVPAALLVLVLVTGAASAVATFLASGSEPTWVRPLAAGVLLVGALLAASPGTGTPTERHGASGSTTPSGVPLDERSLAAPGLAGAAGFVAAASSGAGGVLLALAVGGLAALVVAALARTGLEGEPEHLARLWLLTGGTVCVVAVTWLLLGASPLALAATAFAAAVIATRVLPALAVDVDDDVLLDLDRLAVTAWSAREQPRGGRRRHQVHPRTVREVARRSQRTVGAGVVASALAAAATGPLVVLGLGGDPTTWARWGGVALVLLGSASLALVGRSFRVLGLRVLLGLVAAWLVVSTAVAVALDLDPVALWWCFAATVLVAPAVLLAAVRLGGGWRSVWWARAGEVLEAVTGVLVLALVPLASGLFDLVRTSVG